MFSQNRSLRAPLVLLGLFGVGGACSLVGCGGGDSGSSASTTSRHYTSTVNLTTPQTAALDINVASDNTVAGTMIVSDSSRAAHTRAVVVTVRLTGTIAANGDLSLTGTYTPVEGTAQTTRVTGNLGATTGTLVLNYLNQNFNGTWTYQGAVNPTGGGESVSFSAVTTTNANTTAVTLPTVAGTIITLPTIGKQLTVVGTPNAAGDYSRSLGFSVQGGAVVGTYAIDDDKYQVTYGEGLLNPRQWSASGGTIQIIAVSSTKVSFKITGATMKPVSGTGTPPASGTFTIDMTGETTALVSE